MKITLYVDVVSPFAYVAYHVLRHDPVFQQCEITYIPIFLGGVMHKAGNTPPINIKNKDKWIMQERTRWARYFNVPMIAETPPNFPPLTLTAMRAITALSHLAAAAADNTSADNANAAAQEALVHALDVFYAAYWVHGVAIADREVVAGLVGRIVAETTTTTTTTTTVQEVMEVAGAEGKAMLLRNTERAFAEGAFGLPWMVCENASGAREGFWGVDHLGCVLDFMGLETPRAGAWRAML